MQGMPGCPGCVLLTERVVVGEQLIVASIFITTISVLLVVWTMVVMNTQNISINTLANENRDFRVDLQALQYENQALRVDNLSLRTRDDLSTGKENGRRESDNGAAAVTLMFASTMQFPEPSRLTS